MTDPEPQETPTAELRETLLRFHAYMNNLTFDEAQKEYLGKSFSSGFMGVGDVNKLFMGIETAIRFHQDQRRRAGIGDKTL